MHKDTFLIIDGSSLFFRAFYALPLLKTKRGIYTNAVYGFISMMENAILEIEPKYVVVCFDQKGKTFRHELFDEYKGTREKTPIELDQQWPILMKILKIMNIKVIDSPKFEADDLAGTLAKQASKKNINSYLLTGDKDYFQLIQEDIKVLLTKKGITELEVYDEDRILEQYSLTPKQMIDLKGLMGDNSDNIPGVPGIGEKTGIKLLTEFNSIEGIYNNIDKVTGKKRVENLKNFKKQAYLSRQLGTIVTDVAMNLNIEDLKRKDYDLDTLRALYTKYEFNTLLKRLPEEGEQQEDKINLSYSLVTKADALKKIKGKHKIFFHIVNEGRLYNGIEPEYLIIGAIGEPPYIVKLNGARDLLLFKEIIENKDIKKLSFNLKDDLVDLLSLNLQPRGFNYDLVIAAYILDPTRSNYSISYMVDLYFNEYTKDLEDLIGKGKNKKKISEIPLSDLHLYFASLAYYAPKIQKIQLEKIKEQEMFSLFNDIEMPLVEVLASMEVEGINVDKSILDDIGNQISKDLNSLEENIYDEAGETFNINSPKQLSEILFEKLDLPPSKKTKTGYSTSVDVLEKLQDKHPIIDYILDYRQLSKLYSTYIVGIGDAINEKDGKIHSNFRQTVTATGRLSSTDPNLQNIPIRTETGRLIRKAFKANTGYTFVDADYSQIELRILAHVSQDESMIEAFRNNEDIHRTTASQVFHVDKDQVTTLMRSRAKAVNFGIVYGISDYGLSQDLDIPRADAKKYIDTYLNHFSGVHQFMDKIVDIGKAQGYVETLFNRRRYIPELNAKNYNIRSFGERVALNMPIQGTAADIIKKAMVEVYKQLKDGNYQTKLILQVHDELILEVPDEEVQAVIKLLQETMENTVNLSIPLKVDLETGKNWYDTK